MVNFAVSAEAACEAVEVREEVSDNLLHLIELVCIWRLFERIVNLIAQDEIVQWHTQDLRMKGVEAGLGVAQYCIFN